MPQQNAANKRKVYRFLNTSNDEIKYINEDDSVITISNGVIKTEFADGRVEEEAIHQQSAVDILAAFFNL